MTTLTQPETQPAQKLDRISERTLSRLLKWGAAALVLLLLVFGVFYALGQRSTSGPTLAERQVSAAEDAVKVAPQNVQNRLKLAAAYQNANRFQDAVSQYDEILKAVPTNALAISGLGIAKIKLGDLDGAKALFAKLTAAPKSGEFSGVDPNRQAAHYWLGSIALQQKDYDTALTELNSALAMDKSDADSWYLLGTAQAAKGSDKTAVESLKRALLFVPTGWCEPYVALGQSYSRLSMSAEAEYAGAMTDFCNGDSGSATSRLEALTSGSQAVPALLGLGTIAESTSDKTAAIDWYQKVLKAEPGNPDALKALARLGVTKAAGSTSTTTQGKVS